MKLYRYLGDGYVAAPDERAARKILREEYGLKRSYPVAEVPAEREIQCTTDGDNTVLVPAGELAREHGPGLVPEW